MERIEDSKDPLLKDCYEWILQDPILQEWRDGDTNSLLWINGDPGRGKTMLMIALVREGLGQVGQGHEAFLTDEIQDTLATLFNEHGRSC